MNNRDYAVVNENKSHKIRAKRLGFSGLSINYKTPFLYLMLFAACFNDILRIGESALTLFRILVFIGFLFCISYMGKTYKYIIAFVALSGISFLQSFFFAATNDLGIGISTGRFIQYEYYYLCITIVICAVHALWYVEKDLFFSSFKRFLFLIGYLYLIIFVLIGLNFNIGGVLFINNVNDYGAMLAAIFPFFCVDLVRKHDWKCGLTAMLIIAFLWLNDCKMGLFAVMFEILILCYLYPRYRLKNLRILLDVFTIIFISILLYIIVKKNISINGYSIEYAVMDPIRRMLSGELYAQSDSSVTYRANVMIAGAVWLVKTGFVGIGMGNAGVLMRQVLEDYGLYEKWMSSSAVSLHNALIEFLLEFGYIAIIVIFLFLRNVIRLLKEKKITDSQMIYIAVVVGSLLWIQGPSGILTNYFIYMLFAYLVFQNRAELEKQKRGRK